MKQAKLISKALILLGALACGFVAAAGAGAGVTLDAPMWRMTTMTGDTMLFIKDADGGTATASLWFVPSSAPALSSATGEIRYEIGRDFTWAAGSRTIVLTPQSRIPFKTAAEMHPAPGSPQSMKTKDNEALFFSEGHVFHDLQVAANYDHAGSWNGPVPKFAGQQLSRTLARLKARRPVTVVALGDSITQGYNASGYVQAKPMQPSYPALFTTGLQTHFQTDVTLVNLAVAGKESGWGLSQVPKVVAAKPDLVIIAFGMNETGKTPAKFSEQIRAIIDEVRKTLPDAEFLLVAGMAGNPEWPALRGAAFPEFRDALGALCGQGVALADVTSLWLHLREHKGFADLTGNGVNHPNDFGHRIYAQVLLATLIE